MLCFFFDLKNAAKNFCCHKKESSDGKKNFYCPKKLVVGSTRNVFFVPIPSKNKWRIVGLSIITESRRIIVFYPHF